METSRQIQSKFTSLPPPLLHATTLYQKIIQFESSIQTLSPTARKSVIRPQDYQMYQQTRDELNVLYQQMSDKDDDKKEWNDIEMHNLFQKITWDASADAKASRADGGLMRSDIRQKVDRACERLLDCGEVFLDVGCGPGILIPILKDLMRKKNKKRKEEEMMSIVGVDLSKEMIRNAKERYGNEENVWFVSGDFLAMNWDDYHHLMTNDNGNDDRGGFDGIIFCSSLHDFPDPMMALKKSLTLLNKGGKVIVLHAQGASHVRDQNKANPVMVPKRLPTGSELRAMLEEEEEDKLTLEHEPAEMDSKEDAKEGYLAIVSKELN